MSVALGQLLPPIEKKVFQRALVEREFEENSVHRDDYVQQMGYAGALVSAYIMTGYLSEMMLKFFGNNWLTAGKYNLAFIEKGIQLRDEVVCNAKIVEIEPIGGGSDKRVSLDFWIEKADGVRPVVGKASCIYTA